MALAGVPKEVLMCIDPDGSCCYQALHLLARTGNAQMHDLTRSQVDWGLESQTHAGWRARVNHITSLETHQGI